LVERGNCSFADKVRIMMLSGASAVLVGDNQRNSLITMYSSDDTSDIIIPSVFVAMNEYHELRYKASVAYPYNQLLIWIVGNDAMNWPIMDILLVTVVAPFLLILFGYSVYKLIIRFRPTEVAPSPQIIVKLPTKIFYKEKLKENEPTTCAICLDDFENEEELRMLLCNHHFHKHCIDAWILERKNMCPICRAEIETELVDPGDDDPIDTDQIPVIITSADLIDEHQDDHQDDDETTPLLSIFTSIRSRNVDNVRSQESQIAELPLTSSSAPASFSQQNSSRSSPQENEIPTTESTSHTPRTTITTAASDGTGITNRTASASTSQYASPVELLDFASSETLNDGTEPLLKSDEGRDSKA